MQQIDIPSGKISILRLDLPDPLSGGNKSYKLKYNLEAMRAAGKNTMLSFGGAFSNHIAALAAGGKCEKFQTIGIIRGEELNENSNAVLQFASSCGMQLHFVSREEYRRRNDADFIAELEKEFPGVYLLPEGGSNELAVKGCSEILNEESARADLIFAPVGTGATLAGIIASAKAHQHVTGIAVLEGKTYLENEVRRLLGNREIQCSWEINSDFTFGGYARSNENLLNFISEIQNQFQLPLDPVYSGKAFYAMTEILKAEKFRNAKPLFIHTGGYAFVV